MSDPLLSVMVVALVVLVLAIKLLRSPLSRLCIRLDAISPRAQRLIAIGIAVATAIYLPLTALSQGRSLDPQIQDSLSYAVMARMYASGHLWLPAHPLTEALDSFYLFVTPVYGSMYFPGAGFFYAIPVLLGLPLWTMSAALSGALVGTAFAVLARVRGVSAGLATVLGLVGTAHFRWFSLQVLSHVPMALLVGVCYVAYLRWRGSGARGWLVVLSLGAGLSLITRPYDAMLLLTPVAIAVLIHATRESWRRTLTCTAIAFACVLPFVALQLVINHAYTGNVWKTPFSAYFDRDMPNAGFGFQPFDKQLRPASPLVQKQVFYDDYVRQAMRNHTVGDLVTVGFWRSRFAQWRIGTTQMGILLLPMCIGLMRSFRTPYWPIALAPVAIFVGYVPYPFFQSWYGSSALIGFWVSVWLGVSAIEPMLKLRKEELRTGMVLATSVVAVTCLPEFHRKPLDVIVFHSPELMKIDRLVEEQVRTPAIVFFRYHNAEAYRSQHEPVYNFQTAWPDDAPVVRVHSIGAEADRRVLEYYQRLGPARRVYLIDRANLQLHDLGTIDEALANWRGASSQARDRR